MNKLMTIVLMTVLVLAAISTFTGCEENNLSPEVKSQVGSQPSVSQEISNQKQGLENNIRQFRQRRKLSTDKRAMWYRSMVSAQANYSWAEHKNDDIEIQKWLEVITLLKKERADIEIAEQETNYAMEEKVSEMKGWNEQRPGWWR